MGNGGSAGKLGTIFVHVGFALSVIDDAEARRMFEYLDRIGEIDEQLSPAD